MKASTGASERGGTAAEEDAEEEADEDILGRVGLGRMLEGRDAKYVLWSAAEALQHQMIWTWPTGSAERRL